MSGGHFDYKQFHIGDIAEDIQSLIDRNGKPKKKEDLDPWDIEDDSLNYYEYPEDIIQQFKNAVSFLKIAHIYAQRVDWLLSGDDGEETFLTRLKEELNKLNESNTRI
jgi:hypothetical protein